VEEAILDLQADTDYELCARYCDYWEWLDGPFKPNNQYTIDKYRGYLQQILKEIGRRHKDD
jgi:hypothetical protein